MDLIHLNKAASYCIRLIRVKFFLCNKSSIFIKQQ
jgi:hypothetical protein